MNSERWERINEVFQQALGCSPGSRDSFLADACGDDVDKFRSFVESMAVVGNTDPETASGGQNADVGDAPELADGEKSVCRKLGQSEQRYESWSRVVSANSNDTFNLDDGTTATTEELNQWQR